METLIQQTTKEQVLESLKETDYKNELKHGVFTVWFHEGNGWNFRVSYHFRANKTKIVRYNTNGHVNSDNYAKEFGGLHIAKDHFDAESLFFN